jgi:hypothetical protein
MPALLVLDALLFKQDCRWCLKSVKHHRVDELIVACWFECHQMAIIVHGVSANQGACDFVFVPFSILVGVNCHGCTVQLGLR